MKVLLIVQARMGSSRLPGKVLMPLAGTPLLLRLVERLRAVRTACELVVATTDESADDPIRMLCGQIGVRCFSGHPTDLLDRHFQAALAFGADVVVKIPSDCPLIDPAVVDRVLMFYERHHERYDFVSNLHPATYPDGNDVEVLPLAVLETAWREAVRPHEREHTTPFVWDQPGRFRIGNVSWESGRDLSMSHRFTVDYPDDYAFVSAVYDALWRPARPVFGLTEIFSLLDERPDLFAINQRYAGVNWYRHHLPELATVGVGETCHEPGIRHVGPHWELDELPPLALRVREHIVRMATDGGCFIGASLSCADLIAHLYTRVLRISPETVSDPNRDYLLLSKGHDVPALYATLAELGFMARERLDNHLQLHDSLYWHPNRAVPGVEFHSGSLGHLLSVGIGIALDIKLRQAANRVFVLLGDGELQTGSIWEACLVASALRLDNLVAIVDRNQFQANGRTEDLVPLEPIPAKFEAFGWSSVDVDGHDFEALDAIVRPLSIAPRQAGKPSAVVAKTVRGKGLPSLEARADRWFANFDSREIDALLRELHGDVLSELTSDAQVVR